MIFLKFIFLSFFFFRFYFYFSLLFIYLFFFLRTSIYFYLSPPDGIINFIQFRIWISSPLSILRIFLYPSEFGLGQFVQYAD